MPVTTPGAADRETSSARPDTAASPSSYWTQGGIRVRVVGPGMGAEGCVHETPHPFLRIGRYPSMDFVLEDGRVSRWHLYLHRTEEGVFFVDLGSREGVRVAGRVLPSGWVKSSIPIEVGPYKLFVEDAKPVSEGNLLSRVAEEDDPYVGAELLFQDRAGSIARNRVARRLTLLGRSAPSNLRLAEPSIGLAHLAFYRTRETLWVINLVCLGAYKQGGALDVEEVQPGSEYTLGGYRIRVERLINRPPLQRRAPAREPRRDAADSGHIDSIGAPSGTDLPAIPRPGADTEPAPVDVGAALDAITAELEGHTPVQGIDSSREMSLGPEDGSASSVALPASGQASADGNEPVFAWAPPIEDFESPSAEPSALRSSPGVSLAAFENLQAQLQAVVAEREAAEAKLEEIRFELEESEARRRREAGKRERASQTIQRLLAHAEGAKRHGIDFEQLGVAVARLWEEHREASQGLLTKYPWPEDARLRLTEVLKRHEEALRLAERVIGQVATYEAKAPAPVNEPPPAMLEQVGALTRSLQELERRFQDQARQAELERQRLERQLSASRDEMRHLLDRGPVAPTPIYTPAPSYTPAPAAERIAQDAVPKRWLYSAPAVQPGATPPPPEPAYSAPVAPPRPDPLNDTGIGIPLDPAMTGEVSENSSHLDVAEQLLDRAASLPGDWTLQRIMRMIAIGVVCAAAFSYLIYWVIQTMFAPARSL